MRETLLVLAASALPLLGSTCIPLLGPDIATQQPRGTEPRSLAVSLLAPTSDLSVPLGAVIDVEFTVVNLSGKEVVGSVLLRDLSDGSEIVLAGGIRISASSFNRVVRWDTAETGGGSFRLRVRVEGGGRVAEDSSPARIMVNTPPSLDFLEPSRDVRLGDLPPGLDDPNRFDPNSPFILIRWSASDPDGDGRLQIGLDRGTDHDSGDEIVLFDDLTIGETPLLESRDWDGTDVNGQRVEAGTYHLFARLSDDVNDDVLIDAPGRVIVPAEPNEPQIELGFKRPDEDVDLNDPNKPVEITWTLDEPNDVLVDLKIDTDDDHRNGNERTILAQRLIDKDTTEDTFDWDGDDSEGAPVPDGIYRVFLVLNRGTGQPAIVEAGGLVFKRPDPNMPLIALLEPATDQTAEPGTFVLIRWRDDDPSGSSTIRLEIDDDKQFGEAPEVGDPPRVILEDREAEADGVLDTFSFQVPDDLPPGRYWVFAVIARSGQSDEQTSVAGGQIEVPDPNNPRN